MLRRLNDLTIFDPGRVPGREILARVIGCTAFLAFVFRRVMQLPDWPGVLPGMTWLETLPERFSFLPKALLVQPFDVMTYYRYHGYTDGQITTLWSLELSVWVMETGILLAYVVALLTRDRAQSVARGFMQTVFPLLMAGLPFVVVMSSYTYRDWFPVRSPSHRIGLYAVNALLFAGGAFNVIGILTLRRAFTVMAEARVLIRSGIYRHIRHPLYAAHFLIYACYTFLHCHVVTVVLFVVFVGGQTLRATIEERKLTETFPDYEEYRRKTGMFFPRLRGKNPEVRI